MPKRLYKCVFTQFPLLLTINLSFNLHYTRFFCYETIKYNYQSNDMNWNTEQITALFTCRNRSETIFFPLKGVMQFITFNTHVHGCGVLQLLCSSVHIFSKLQASIDNCMWTTKCCILYWVWVYTYVYTHSVHRNNTCMHAIKTNLFNK